MPALVLTKMGNAGGFGFWRVGLHPALRVMVSGNSEPKATKLNLEVYNKGKSYMPEVSLPQQRLCSWFYSVKKIKDNF